MPIIWKTHKINIQNYYKIIRRYFILQGNYELWQKVKQETTITVISVEDAKKFKKFYEHLNIEVSDSMAWGVKGKNEIFWFVIDSRNPFTIRSNAIIGTHEFAHEIVDRVVPNIRITRQYDAPEGKAGTEGPARTVLVHDVWYGSKKRFTFWISWGIGWIPISTVSIRDQIQKFISV